MIELCVAILLGMLFHEAAHGAVAELLGDPTAELLGRVTLNPAAHMTLVGSILVPIGSILALGVPIGWGKPVPVNRLLLSRFDYIVVLLAGPAANLYMAGIFALAGLYHGAAVNLALAAVNLIPVSPLDGGRILREFL